MSKEKPLLKKYILVYFLGIIPSHYYSRGFQNFINDKEALPTILSFLESKSTYKGK